MLSAEERAPPRAYRGNLSARFIDFLRAYASSLAIDPEDEEPMLVVASNIAKAFAQIGKVDLGLVQGTLRETAEKLVVENGGRIEWLDTWQDLMELYKACELRFAFGTQ